MLSAHKKAHQSCRCAAARTRRLRPGHAAQPAQTSARGAEAGATCWMSCSSCSRCSRETLYCSSRTSAKYSVLRIDSFSFTVRMMSCGHRGTGVTEEWPALTFRHRAGRAPLTSPLLLRAARERKARAGWVHCQYRRLILMGHNHPFRAQCPLLSSPQGSSTPPYGHPLWLYLGG